MLSYITVIPGTSIPQHSKLLSSTSLSTVVLLMHSVHLAAFVGGLYSGLPATVHTSENLPKYLMALKVTNWHVSFRHCCFITLSDLFSYRLQEGIMPAIIPSLFVSPTCLWNLASLPFLSLTHPVELAHCAGTCCTEVYVVLTLQTGSLGSLWFSVLCPCSRCSAQVNRS